MSAVVKPALSLILVFALVGAARADDRALAREHFQKGSKAFALGAYDEAIAEYSAAYRAKDDPALLYNIAQAHRLATHAADALRFYKMYLSLLPKAPNRDEVEGKIAELQKLVDQQKKTATAMPPDSVKQPSETSRIEPPPEKPPAPIAVNPAPPAPPAPERAAVVDLHPGRAKKIAGVTVAGVGVAALVVGIALGAVAKGYEDDIVAQYDPRKASDGDTFGTVGPVLIGIGGAAVVAGVVVAVLGFKESRSASARKLSLLPTIGPSGGAALLRVSF